MKKNLQLYIFVTLLGFMASTIKIFKDFLYYIILYYLLKNLWANFSTYHSHLVNFKI